MYREIDVHACYVRLCPHYPGAPFTYITRVWRSTSCVTCVMKCCERTTGAGVTSSPSAKKPWPSSHQLIMMMEAVM